MFGRRQNRSPNSTIARVLPPLVTASLALAVLSCTSDADDTEPTSRSSQPTDEPALRIENAWVKAAPDGMTAAFGTLVNDSDRKIRVVRASSPATDRMELHEVADVNGESTMRVKEGGFVVPSDGEHSLEPGGDHLMLMNVTDPVRPGAKVRFTLELQDGSTVEFAAPAKDTAGGDEDYHQPNGEQDNDSRHDGDDQGGAQGGEQDNG